MKASCRKVPADLTGNTADVGREDIGGILNRSTSLRIGNTRSWGKLLFLYQQETVTGRGHV